MDTDPVDVKPGGLNLAERMLHALMLACVTHDASDLHLTPGLSPRLRVHGELKSIPGHPVITADDSAAMAKILLHRQQGVSAQLDESLQLKGSVDGALTAPDGSRFRFNYFRRQNQIAIVLRRLEETFRSLSDLGLPESLHALTDLRDGLVVISGATGAGKSTTLATLLDRVNRTRSAHIITIEDPIEYIHKPVKCVVNQRQIGVDAPCFNDALVSALRQDPDVILVGEIRDLETIRTAITAAETGHLVFTTLHAGDCVSSIERLVSVFPADEQDGIRRQLSLVLRAIIAQHLLPTQGKGRTDSSRVASSEILLVNPAIANLIATGRSTQIYSCMEAGQMYGMQTLEQDLARLWVKGTISDAVANATARNTGTLRDRVELLRKGQAATVSSGGQR